jgi:uncharacterized protein YjcR
MAVPWTKIRAEWLKGGITQKALAEKYGVNLKTLQNRASKEGWRKQKGKIREKTEELLCQRVARARVNHLEKIIEAQEDVLDALRQLAAELKQDPKALLMDRQGTIRNAESITRALQTATMTQRDLHNLKNIDQKFAAKKWKEQLKLEKEKAKGPEASTGPLMMIVHEPAEETAEDGDAVE